MLFRIITVLVCIVVFINGCNSLISLQFGTHKLRAYTMEEALTKGIGDADYIELRDAWTTGDYVYVSGKRKTDKPIIIFPLVSSAQLAQIDQGQTVQPRFIGWTEKFPAICVDNANCAPRLQGSFKGIIRDLSKEKDRTVQLSAQKFTLPADPIFVETGREPLAWYWNLAMMVAAFLIAFALERKQFLKRNAG